MGKLNPWVITIAGSIPGTRIVRTRLESKEECERYIAHFFDDSDDAAIDYDPDHEITSALQDRF